MAGACFEPQGGIMQSITGIVSEVVNPFRVRKLSLYEIEVPVDSHP